MRARETLSVLVAVITFGAAVALQGCANAKTEDPCAPLSLCGGSCLGPQAFLSDEQNCGACGAACAAGETCLAGACTPGYSRFIDHFEPSMQNSVATCQDFRDVIAGLAGSYRRINLAGSNRPLGETCADPVTVTSLIAAAKAGTGQTSLPCGGKVWTVCQCVGTEITVAPASSCCQCKSKGEGWATLRPCITLQSNNSNWGGIDAEPVPTTANGTCHVSNPTEADSQTLSITFIR